MKVAALSTPPSLTALMLAPVLLAPLAPPAHALCVFIPNTNEEALDSSLGDGSGSWLEARRGGVLWVPLGAVSSDNASVELIPNYEAIGLPPDSFTAPVVGVIGQWAAVAVPSNTDGVLGYTVLSVQGSHEWVYLSELPPIVSSGEVTIRRPRVDVVQTAERPRPPCDDSGSMLSFATNLAWYFTTREVVHTHATISFVVNSTAEIEGGEREPVNRWAALDVQLRKSDADGELLDRRLVARPGSMTPTGEVSFDLIDPGAYSLEVSAIDMRTGMRSAPLTTPVVIDYPTLPGCRCLHSTAGFPFVPTLFIIAVFAFGGLRVRRRHPR